METTISKSACFSRFTPSRVSSLSAVILGYTYDIEAASARSFRFLFSRVGLFICMILIYYVLLQALDTLHAQAVLEEQARTGVELLTLPRRQYELLVILTVDNGPVEELAGTGGPSLPFFPC